MSKGRDLVEKLTKQSKKIEDTEDDNIAEIQMSNSIKAEKLKTLFLALAVVNLAVIAGIVVVGTRMYGVETKADKEKTLDKTFEVKLKEQRTNLETKKTSILHLKDGSVVREIIDVTAKKQPSIVTLEDLQSKVRTVREEEAVEMKKLYDHYYAKLDDKNSTKDTSQTLQKHYLNYQALFKFNGCPGQNGACTTAQVWSSTATNSTGIVDCMKGCYKNGNKTMKGFTYESATKKCSCDEVGATKQNLASGFFYYMFL